MKQIMQGDIEKRFSFIESEDLYRVTIYLDPRYKNKLFSSSIITDQVKVTIARLCAQLSRINKRTTIEDKSPSKKQKGDDSGKSNKFKTVSNTMISILTSNSDDETEESSAERTIAETEIDGYHKQKRITVTSTESLQWWKKMENIYPNLVKGASQYLCCPPSSVPSKQLFSSVGLIYNTKQKQLSLEKAEKLLFLKKNLPLLNFKY